MRVADDGEASAEEIARLLGMSRGQQSIDERRALKKLRAALEDSRAKVKPRP